MKGEIEAEELMHKKELIFLDAKLKAVIQNRAFRAELENGHAFVAWLPIESGLRCGPGDTVGVQLLPSDLSTGKIILKKEMVAS